MNNQDGRTARQSILNWQRLAISLPALAVVGAGLFLLINRGDATATTPRAVLMEPPAVVGLDVGVRKGDVARDFSASGPDGSSVQLSDLRGLPVVVNFWATWCTSCLAEMPELQQVQREFGADKVAVVAVNSGESATTAQEFVDFLDAADFHYAYDPSLAVTDAYGVIGLSTSVFIDAQGVIRATYTGQLSKDLMREFIAAASASTTAAEPPPKFRLPGSVEARTSALVVSEESEGSLRFASRRLRCDDTFCADPVVSGLRALGGVVEVTPLLDADPPTLLVTFNDAVVPEDRLIESVVSLIEQMDDSLYQQPVTVERR